MIARITRIYTRRYSDNGMYRAYVEWTDQRGITGRTEGEPDNAHMLALMDRARREGIPQTHEEW